MPIPRRLRTACSVILVGAVTALSAPASADTVSVGVGGPLLSRAGIVTAPGTPALPIGVSATGWLVADLDTGEVLAARNAHTRFAPASTLKTLTALTLIPRLDPKSSAIPTSQDVNVDGTRVGLVENVRYPIPQLFTAMLIVSGNDAANTLATRAGGIVQTVREMNTEAQRISAFDTHAATPNGLDAPGQSSSPYDLALIARAAMALPDFRRYVATKHSSILGPKGPIAISSHDKLLYNYPGAIGIKNGYTVKARASFVGAATRHGHTLIVTLMHCNPRYWPEAAALLDWGFRAEAAGLTPIGTLVAPGTTAHTAAAALPADTGPIQVAAGPTGSNSVDGPPMLPAAVVGLGLLTVGGGVLRSRRRTSGGAPTRRS